jgi:hypothetical protein
MTARDDYRASVIAAEKKKIADFQAATRAAQVSFNAASIDAGVHPSRGADAALITATTNLNAAYQAARLLGEMNKQVTIQNAKDLLRSTGDNAPA